jgi:hypothetical protein
VAIRIVSQSPATVYGWLYVPTGNLFDAEQGATAKAIGEGVGEVALSKQQAANLQDRHGRAVPAAHDGKLSAGGGLIPIVFATGGPGAGHARPVLFILEVSIVSQPRFSRALVTVQALLSASKAGHAPVFAPNFAEIPPPVFPALYPNPARSGPPFALPSPAPGALFLDRHFNSNSGAQAKI